MSSPLSLQRIASREFNKKFPRKVQKSLPLRSTIVLNNQHIKELSFCVNFLSDHLNISDGIFRTHPNEVLEIFIETANLTPENMLRDVKKIHHNTNLPIQDYIDPSDYPELKSLSKFYKDFIECWVTASSVFSSIYDEEPQIQFEGLRVILALLFGVSTKGNDKPLVFDYNYPFEFDWIKLSPEVFRSVYRPFIIIVCTCANTKKPPSSCNCDGCLYELSGLMDSYINIYTKNPLKQYSFYKNPEVPGVTLNAFGKGYSEQHWNFIYGSPPPHTVFKYFQDDLTKFTTKYADIFTGAIYRIENMSMYEESLLNQLATKFNEVSGEVAGVRLINFDRDIDVKRLDPSYEGQHIDMNLPDS